ncbi:MAG TPA: hypothetical protein ENI85_18530 [Deltaproteobacteria bacterium]|nr:hypothetical protein [Deltaproteobacteria bacterium]
MSERSSRATIFARLPWWTLAGSTIVIAFAWSLCRRGINLSDEGYLLSQVVDMMAGKVLYRDMDAFVTPGIWFFLAGLFEFVEPSVLSSRILSFAGYLATLFVAYRIVTRLTSRAWGWSSVALLLVFSVWAFPAWTTVFYSPFAILFALAALERLLAWRERRRRIEMLSCGVLLGLSILCKQNYGVFASVGIVAGILAIEFEDGKSASGWLRDVFSIGLQLAAGIATVALPTVAYLAYQDALLPAFQLLVLHPFEFMSRQDIAYPPISMLWAPDPLSNVDALTYGAYSFSQAPNPFFSRSPILSWPLHAQLLERLHILLFWLPPPGLAVGAWIALRPIPSRRPVDGALFSAVALSGSVFLGIFPRADFNHLINVYQPVLIAFVLMAHRMVEAWKNLPPESRTPVRVALSRIAVGFVGLLLFMYSGIALSWYVHTLKALTEPVPGPRGGVLVTTIDRDLIDFHIRTIHELTDEDEAVLTVPALSMLDFLSERSVPGRYYNLYEHHIAHDGGLGVVNDAESHHVNIVVADFNNFFSDRVGLRVYAPELASYLTTRFEPVLDVAGDRFRYLKRRPHPVRERPGEDLVAYCDLGGQFEPYAREHLLFASLYQPRNPRNPIAPVETRCTFRVPERGELSFSLGYRKPFAVQRGAIIKAQIWIAGHEQDGPLFDETIPIERQKGWSSPPPPRHRVDLSKYSGSDVTLIVRAQFRGGARMGPLDLSGFSLVWENPRIETRQGRVLLIGIDGATFRVIRPLMTAGRLPNLQAVAGEGVHGPLRSAFPLVSPRIWTTIATGKVPLKHGIHHWIRKAADGSTRLNLGTDRLVPAIWNITSSFGFTNGVVNWLNTYPPEKINGVMISDFAIAGQREARERLFAGNEQAKGHVGESVTYPSEWQDILEELNRDARPLLDHRNPFDHNEALPAWLRQDIPAESFRDDDLVTRMALEVQDRLHPEIMLVYLSGIDKVSHNTWGAMEPPTAYPPHIHFTDSERAATRAALEDYYVYTDELIGRLLDGYGPDDLVLIVSDHGFEAELLVQWLTGGHESEKAVNGILFARGPGVPRGKTILPSDVPGIADITPTILAWLGLPVAADMDGHVARFVEIDSVEKVPSYDDIPVERETDDRGEVEDSIMDQLRSLGYVE